jgi:serine/threonine protein kinase
MIEEEFYKQTTLTDISSPKERAGPIPAKIGPYKIESLLSKGGMSVIYLGLHPETKELIIVKVLSPEYVTHPEMIERFLKEAKIIGMTNHPNIVKLFGQGTWEGGLYIAMEFIRGVSLKQFIIQQSLSLKRSVDIILQVAYALLHLHSHNVIHGDLKPENILITEDGEVKVIDFGIARLYGESSHSTKIAGTPAYMAPEQKENTAKMSFSSDIYSLGIIAYELAMGKLSFGVIHPSLLPKGLRKIIQKALAISMDERYSDIMTFISDLSQYLKSGGLEKDKPGSDQLKEVLEMIQMAGQSLSPSTLPSWPGVEMGLTKYRAPGQGGSYFDFFKFPDNTYGIVMAESTAVNLDGTVYIGVLRGMIRTFLKDKPFDPMWITHVNQIVKEDWIGQKFSLAFLRLNPMLDTLSLTLCGLGGLVHASQGSTSPRKFSSQNPLVGQESNTEFFATVDNWAIGDMLTFYSLDVAMDTYLLEAIVENTLLSAQAQAEALIKKTATHTSFSLQKNPKVLITLQRIG